jgi:hypothetical protein
VRNEGLIYGGNLTFLRENFGFKTQTHLARWLRIPEQIVTINRIEATTDKESLTAHRKKISETLADFFLDFKETRKERDPLQQVGIKRVRGFSDPQGSIENSTKKRKADPSFIPISKQDIRDPTLQKVVHEVRSEGLAYGANLRFLHDNFGFSSRAHLGAQVGVNALRIGAIETTSCKENLTPPRRKLSKQLACYFLGLIDMEIKKANLT